VALQLGVQRYCVRGERAGASPGRNAATPAVRTPAQWPGVVCGDPEVENGVQVRHVEALLLQRCCLKGELVLDTLQGLPRLQLLDLSGNLFSDITQVRRSSSRAGHSCAPCSCPRLGRTRWAT
jgi:hypothetical protein